MTPSKRVPSKGRDMSILQTGKDINIKRKICQSIKMLSGNKIYIFPRFQLYAGCMYVWTLRFCNHVKRAMLHGAIRNDNFSATRSCKFVATVFRNVTSLFQHCCPITRSCNSSCVKSPIVIKGWLYFQLPRISW